MLGIHTNSLPLFRLDPDTDNVVTIALALEDVGPQSVLALCALGFGPVRAEKSDCVQSSVVQLAGRHCGLQDVAGALQHHTQTGISERLRGHANCEAGYPSEKRCAANNTVI